MADGKHKYLVGNNYLLKCKSCLKKESINTKLFMFVMDKSKILRGEGSLKTSFSSKEIF
jgi:hypothetical protein